MKPANAPGPGELALSAELSFEPFMTVHFWASLGENSLCSDPVMDQGPFSVLYSSGNTFVTLV